MVALASLPYPYATFITYKAHETTGITMIQSSICVDSSLRRIKRKNYLRPKILKTLTKPYNIPSEHPITAPIQTFEPNVDVSVEPTVEKLISSFVEEPETALGLDGSGLGQVEVVRNSEAQNSVGIDGISGRTIVRIVGSFVGLFILQTVVAVWIMGFDNSKEKDGNLAIEDRKRDLRFEMRGEETGVDGNAFLRNWAGVNVDESEMEAKITEIRKMAWEIREAEKRMKVENGEADFDNVSHDDDNDEDFENDSSKINSGIVKEVDGRLSKLRKKYPAPLLNVTLMNKSGGSGKEAKDEGLDGKKEDNMLFVKMKDRFRSHVTQRKEKPEGFQGIDGVIEKQNNTDAGKLVEKTEVSNDVDLEMNVLDSTIPKKSDNSMGKEEKIPVSQSSSPLKGARKRHVDNSAEKKLGKGLNGSTASGSNGTAKKLSKGINEATKPERGLVQDSSNGKILSGGTGVKKSSPNATQDKRKMNEHVVSTTSDMLAMPQRKGQLNLDQPASKISRSTEKDKQENFHPWWSRLPYVLVILMQQGIESEAQRGFYNIGLYTDAENQPYSSYTVAFEDQNDAKNFSYLLESAFEDLPDAAVDVAPLSNKDFKEVAESLDNKVIVVKKGELKLYAGQPFADVEAALRSLLK